MLVCAVKVSPLSPVTVTVTPGMAAPNESVTVPEIVARFTCAPATVAPARHTTTNNASRYALIAGPPPEQQRPLQPVVKLQLHSAGDASPLTALLLPQIFPIFSVVAPCHRGASPPSVRHRIYERQHLAHFLETGLTLPPPTIVSRLRASRASRSGGAASPVIVRNCS